MLCWARGAAMHLRSGGALRSPLGAARGLALSVSRLACVEWHVWSCVPTRPSPRRKQHAYQQREASSGGETARPTPTYRYRPGRLSAVLVL